MAAERIAIGDARDVPRSKAARISANEIATGWRLGSRCLSPWLGQSRKDPKCTGRTGYSTVTLLARLRGWSTSVPFSTATW